MDLMAPISYHLPKSEVRQSVVHGSLTFAKAQDRAGQNRLLERRPSRRKKSTGKDWQCDDLQENIATTLQRI
jgi:hypothetical protein